jgi:hypothetical protein
MLTDGGSLAMEGGEVLVFGKLGALRHSYLPLRFSLHCQYNGTGEERQPENFYGAIKRIYGKRDTVYTESRNYADFLSIF